MINKLLFASVLVTIALITSCLDTDKADAFDAVEQFNIEQANVEQYIEDNELVALKDTLYGLYYVVNVEGTGNRYIVDSDTLTLAYKGKLLGATTYFDQSDSTQFVLNKLIPGWRVCLPYVTEGADVTLFIPSAFGYGYYGYGPIPGNATLEFDIQIKKIGKY